MAIVVVRTKLPGGRLSRGGDLSRWAGCAARDSDGRSILKSTFAGSTSFYDTILPTSGALANWLPAGKSTVYNQPVPFFSNDAIYAKVVGYAQHVPSNNTGAYYYEARDAVSTAITKILGGADPAASLKEAQDTVTFAMK